MFILIIKGLLIKSNNLFQTLHWHGDCLHFVNKTINSNAGTGFT